jgi:hypothetical protein
LLGEHRATLAQLYDSLGAPCGTVDAKISELNASLIETVKQQRRDAEHEVDGVRRQVDEARRSVLEMRKALGDETDEPVRSGEVRSAGLRLLAMRQLKRSGPARGSQEATGRPRRPLDRAHRPPEAVRPCL